MQLLCVIPLCFATASADRSGMAVLRLLATAAVCVILWSFAAENRKSYCSGCMKVANSALAADFDPFWHTLRSRFSM